MLIKGKENIAVINVRKLPKRNALSKEKAKTICLQFAQYVKSNSKGKPHIRFTVLQNVKALLKRLEIIKRARRKNNA